MLEIGLKVARITAAALSYTRRSALLLTYLLATLVQATWKAIWNSAPAARLVQSVQRMLHVAILLQLLWGPGCLPPWAPAALLLPLAQEVAACVAWTDPAESSPSALQQRAHMVGELMDTSTHSALLGELLESPWTAVPGGVRSPTIPATRCSPLKTIVQACTSGGPHFSVAGSCTAWQQRPCCSL